jgi:hypothetical protein
LPRPLFRPRTNYMYVHVIKSQIHLVRQSLQCCKKSQPGFDSETRTDAFHKLITPCLLEVQEAGGGAGRVGGLRRVGGGGGGGGVHRDCHRHREALLQRLSSLCK